MPSTFAGLAASLALATSLASASPAGLRLRAAIPHSTTTTTNTTAPVACPPGGGGTVRRPAMYVLLPETPGAAAEATAALEIRHQAGRPRQEQAAAFAGVPAGARACTLGWEQGPAAARDFRVEGSGLLTVRQLPGAPAAGGAVAYADVAPLLAAADAAGAPVAQPDLTAWNAPEYGNWTHGSWDLDCAAEIYLHVAGAEVNGDGYAFLGQDDRNGLFINYQC